jgi:hypothetical protein
VDHEHAEIALRDFKANFWVDADVKRRCALQEIRAPHRFSTSCRRALARERRSFGAHRERRSPELRWDTPRNAAPGVDMQSAGMDRVLGLRKLGQLTRRLR